MAKAFPPDVQKTEDARALFHAAADGDAAAVASLLDAGADPSARRSDGFTPLLLAVFFGHEHVVRLLLERGADPRPRTKLGTTAAGWAAARGFVEMTALLREAEAVLPPVEATAAATDSQAISADSQAEREGAPARPVQAAKQYEEVDIFSWKSDRGSSLKAERGSRPEAHDATADENDGMAGVAASDFERLSGPAVNVYVRGDGRVPAHPSASAFSLGHFLRSWQGSVGAALLLLAFGVSVYALLRGGSAPRGVVQPTPAPTVPQAAALPPAPNTPAPQPTPAFPTPDPLAAMPVNDPAYVVPNNVGQPFYVPPPAPVSGPPSNAPRELMVVSESGAPTPEESARQRRRTDASANDSAPPARQAEAPGEQGAAPDTRAQRSTRPPETEQQRPAQSSTQSAPAPTPQPTPGRAKVIQWPPQ